jgi:hypothetical protein
MSLRLNGSTSGYSEIDAPAIAGNNTLVLPTTNGAANQLLKNGSTPGVLEYALTTLDSSGNLGSIASINGGPLAGFRNRIINGDMRIDQRNGGGAVTINASSLTYSVDRWAAFGMASAGVFTINRSTTVPSGFANSLAAVCTTADSTIAAGDRYIINQPIEGFNAADLGFGAAGAQTVTLSFWVQSSLTGTYCAALINSDGNRSYVAEYDINAANTWEYKTITVAGDTSGTWLSDNGIGVAIRFTLATGTTYQTTANAWAAGNFNATSNQVNWMSSSSSRTFRITGVQLEPGPVATPFERRPIGTELALCQRYYETGRVSAFATATNTHHLGAPCFYKVTKRAVPTVALVSVASVQFPGTVGSIQAPTTIGFNEVRVADNTGANGQFQSDFTASAEL